MISKIIWQTYSDTWENLPDYIKVDANNWKDMNPDWDYKFYDEQARRDFIQTYYPE